MGDAGGIRQYRITEIKQGIKIQIVNFSGYKQWYEGTNDSCTLEKIGGGDFPRFLYSNIEAAQSAQLEERIKEIDAAKHNMLAAQDKYFKLVEAYKGTVYDKEPINKLF